MARHTQKARFVAPEEELDSRERLAEPVMDQRPVVEGRLPLYLSR